MPPRTRRRRCGSAKPCAPRALRSGSTRANCAAATPGIGRSESRFTTARCSSRSSPGNSDARTEGYFRREWRLAVERTHDMADDAPFLLPVAIDDTTRGQRPCSGAVPRSAVDAAPGRSHDGSVRRARAAAARRPSNQLSAHRLPRWPADRRPLPAAAQRQGQTGRGGDWRSRRCLLLAAARSSRRLFRREPAHGRRPPLRSRRTPVARRPAAANAQHGARRNPSRCCRL